MRRTELPGVWSLVAFHDLGPGERALEGPLGPDPRGLLIYSRDGHMSVSIMRTAESAGTPSTPVPLEFMGYAGRWRVEGDTVVHEVTITHTPRMANTEQVREARIDGTRLTLDGTVPTAAGPLRRRLVWDRVGEQP